MADVARSSETFRDPGDGGEINPTKSAYVELRVGDANETRTVAQPTGPGQILLLKRVTAGSGGLDVAFPTFVSSANRSTAVLNSRYDTVICRSYKCGAALSNTGYCWRGESNLGASYAT
jgi:hypothetical protein